METFKNYVWIFPMLAGVFSIICLFVPAFFLAEVPLAMASMIGIATFELSAGLLLGGLISSIIVIIGAALNIIFSIVHLRNKEKLKSAGIRWLIGGILILVGVLLYMYTLIDATGAGHSLEGFTIVFFYGFWIQFINIALIIFAFIISRLSKTGET